MMRFWMGALLFACSIMQAAYAKPMNTDTLHTAELPNGLKIITIEDHRAPVVVHSVWFRAGSIDEQQGQTGIAHMLEHLMFKGTETMKAGERDVRMKQLGAQENAFTSHDVTAYYQKGGKQHLGEFMALESGRLGGKLRITEEDFVPEKNVVLEERRMRYENDPTAKFFEHMYTNHYTASGYHHPVIGWEEDIKNYKLDYAKEWYNTHYAPNNATLIVGGDVTHAEVVALAEKHYGDLPRVETPSRTITAEPLHDAQTRFQEADANTNVPILAMFFRAPSAFTRVAEAPSGNDDGKTFDGTALSVLSEILGGGETSRLYSALVKEQQLADSADTYYNDVVAGESFLGIYLQPKAGVKLSVLESAVMAVLKEVQENGVTSDEVARARTSLLAGDVYGKDDVFRQVYALGDWLMAGGKAQDHDDWKEALAKLNAQDVQTAAQQFIQPQHATVGYLGTAEADF